MIVSRTEFLCNQLIDFKKNIDFPGQIITFIIVLYMLGDEKTTSGYHVYA